MRVLAVIEFLEDDVDEVAWNNFYSSSSVYFGSGSRMIVTSRSNKVMKFGTTQALVLNFLPPEAFWYLFKILTFGSEDSINHPVLESIAMEIARGLNGSFMNANIMSAFMKNNFTSRHWRMFLTDLKENIQRNISLFGESPSVLMSKSKPIIWQISGGGFLVWDKYRACLNKEKAPTATLEDVVSGNVNYKGEFEVFQWKSHILPCSSYSVSCLIQKSK